MGHYHVEVGHVWNPQIGAVSDSILFLFQFLQYHFFVVFLVTRLPVFTGTCIATPLPVKKITYKTCLFLSNYWSFAVLGGPYFFFFFFFFANLPNRFNKINTRFIASDYICKCLYWKLEQSFGYINSLLLLTINQQMRHPPGGNLPNIQDIL